MAEREISPTSYGRVLAILLCLTCLTVGVSFFHLPGFWHIALGAVVALIKASLVVLFFMHALVSPRLTWCVIAAAILWMLILISLTLCDYFTRGHMPLMPGH